MQELCVYNLAGTMLLCFERVDVTSLTVKCLKAMVCKSMGLEVPADTTAQPHCGQLLLLMEGRSLEDREELDALWPMEGPLDLQVLARSIKGATEMFLEANLAERWQELYHFEVNDSGDVVMPHVAIDDFHVRHELVPDLVTALSAPGIEVAQQGQFRCRLCWRQMPDLACLIAHLNTKYNLSVR
mmetsp:Transcript_18151/g.33346  ORF Transcript_18151/g.33346 Transcript_18151/m.33346 type:complete len:185 (+) Transcript_18151:91-645(+)